MEEPKVIHSYVQINESFVHIAQYGFQANILRSPSLTQTSLSEFSANNSDSTISWPSNTTISTSGLLDGSSCANSSGIGRTFQESQLNDVTYGNVAAKSNKHKKIIVFVPGNPGILGIYHDFLVNLYKTFSLSPLGDREDHPVILALSHNNFDHPDHVDYRAEERIRVHESDLNFVEKAIFKNHLDEPHHLELQIVNKLIILKKLLKYELKHCRFVFIGHSIGCYIILKLLQDKMISSAHSGSIMIHPALENVAKTQRGLRVSTYFDFKLDLIGQTLALIIDNCLPKTIKIALTRWFCSEKFVNNSSEIAIESVAQLVCQRTYTALVEMAKSEFAMVKNINTEAMIKPHESKLKLIYAINDGWVNIDNKKLLRDTYPDLHIEEQPTLHAFVMDPKTVMDYAVKTGNYIQDFFDNIV